MTCNGVQMSHEASGFQQGSPARTDFNVATAEALFGLPSVVRRHVEADLELRHTAKDTIQHRVVPIFLFGTLKA